MSRHPSPSLRHLVLVLSDQLDADAAANCIALLAGTSRTP